ncbi:hypothetical protein AUEXF2481DRAFT_586112 [Aureobasidium subglaciale EXF-2481]|uniref:Uncharacterized protein n=1 Tax=Aureobasidium subglaciale (strain EXF-2481) TaxID=1043005 RepID=A0A074ZF79_AURSE|nr:uncharacterized protein AUEXF2481DRAFT_586112 [Aureobasidium subglaciale EXF-2481]KEQ97276.1 hypothetical protein AUEXF2481DRAFT_586112 [Aureobasidium subglaciale EXF-2481]
MSGRELVTGRVVLVDMVDFVLVYEIETIRRQASEQKDHCCDLAELLEPKDDSCKTILFAAFLCVHHNYSCSHFSFNYSVSQMVTRNSMDLCCIYIRSERTHSNRRAIVQSNQYHTSETFDLTHLRRCRMRETMLPNSPVSGCGGNWIFSCFVFSYICQQSMTRLSDQPSSRQVNNQNHVNSQNAFAVI